MIWLIGTGPMAADYVRVLLAQNQLFQVVGRSEQNSTDFSKKYNVDVISGGIQQLISTNPARPDFAIVCVGVEQLHSATMQLLNFGVKNILVEKPAGLNVAEISALAENAKKRGANVFVAYNRRFYASVLKAKEIIKADGGVSSFNFEVTEWAHVLDKLTKNPDVMQHWFLANSTHVADLAFHLGGIPVELNAFTAGENKLSWHSSASAFVGAGQSDQGALFSYHGNWQAPGRWFVEILTHKHRLYFKPLEELHIQEKGNITITKVDIDDQLDKQFKPGLYLQTKVFLCGDSSSLCTIHHQLACVSLYEKMAGYGSR